MAVPARYVAILCILKVVSSLPSGFWPEYIDDGNTNLIDSKFGDDTTSTTAVSSDTGIDDNSASTVNGYRLETADETTTAVRFETARDDDLDLPADENLEEETADQTASEAAETTSTGQDSTLTTANGADSNNSTSWSTTTIVADTTSTQTEPQDSTLSPPSQKPPQDKPKKSWAEIFCDKVGQFLGFMGHKISDTVSFIQRLFHWLY